MKILTNLCWVLGLLFVFSSVNAQNSPTIPVITIEECYQWTRKNYPLIQQLGLIDRTTEYNLSNASKGNLPQVNINGQATYQSEVTSLPISLPNAEIPSIDKDQYKIFGEVYQPLTNFKNIKSQKNLIAANGEIEKQKLEVELYQLKERINNIYFGILLIDSKIGQLKIVKIDLDSALVRIQAAVQNGTATIMDEQLLNVEMISLLQQIEENYANKLAFLKMLSTLTGKNITTDTQIAKPSNQELPTEINRPELKLFSLQNQVLSLYETQIKNKIIPNVGLFIQGGFGRPALNFLSNDFAPYYIGGIKFNWNLSKLYASKNDKQSLNVTSSKINQRRETFLLNNSLTQSLQNSEIEKYNSLIQSDKKIIQIRETVEETAQVQLSNGLITTIDYIKFLNEVSKARQMLALHEAQLLLAKYNLKTTIGN